MWDAYRGTRSRGGLFLSLLPLSFPLQLGVRRGAAPRLGLNASMLSQRRAFLRALNVQWQQSSTHAIAWLAGSETSSPLPRPHLQRASHSLSRSIRRITSRRNLFRKYAKQMSFVVILYERNI